MKRIVLSILVFFICTASAFAKTLPPHMSGIGVFTWQETVGVNPVEFAKEAKLHKLSFVIVKSHDGERWGTKIGKTWKNAITKELVAALHHEGLRVYSYFTARLKHRETVIESVALATRTLEMNVDGVVVDDLGLFGKSRSNWELLFSKLRKEISKRQGAILAASSFPHLMRWDDCPWDVAIKYSDFFLPQSYWKLFRNMTPENAIAYTQANIDALKAYHPESKVVIVPVGMSYGRGVTAHEVERFLKTAAPYYAGVVLFRMGTMPSGGWNVIEIESKAYDNNRSLKQLSLIEIVKQKPDKQKKPVKKKKRSSRSKNDVRDAITVRRK